MRGVLAGMAAVVVFGLVGVAVAQQPVNVTQWRGGARDGGATGFAPPATWPEQLRQRWKIDVGTGYATPLVVGNRVYIFSRQGDEEVMSALDAESGKAVWRTPYAAPFTPMSAAAGHGPGPKSTPVFANNRLFSIGMTGIVTAYDAASGKPLWTKPASPPTQYTTHSFSPIIEGSNVIFHVGGQDEGALTAFDMASGTVKWRWAGDGPGYGSPVVVTLGGTRQIVTGTQAKIVGVEVANGALLWELPFPTQATTNSLTPLFYGQTFIIGGNGRPLEAYAPTKRDNTWVVVKVWENADVMMRMSNGIIVGDTVFSLSTKNAGQYFIADAKTGKTIWTSEGRQATNASIWKAGDTVLSMESDGELVVMRVSATAAEPVRRYKLSDEETWGAPSLAGNRLFVKSVNTLALWTVN